MSKVTPVSAGSTALDPLHNNFGVLRLLFAALVILAHSPDLLLGPGHELLSKAVGTITFGGLAVNGFFLISGFLIVKSWNGDPTLSSFFGKRILRIWPGYAVAVILSTAAVLAIASKEPVPVSAQAVQCLKDLVRLRLPESLTTLGFRHFPSINGALWTIQWEFKCYALTALLGILGLSKRRWPWIVLLFLAAVVVVWKASRGYMGVNVPSVQGARFALFFAAGALFYLYRDRLVYDRRWAVGAALAMIATMFWAPTAEIGMATFGGYLLFATAFARIPFVAHVGTRNDVSYGLYLYAWPVQQLLVFYFPSISLASHVVASLILSSALGFLSWRLVESPALNLVRRKPKAVPAITSAVVLFSPDRIVPTSSAERRSSTSEAETSRS